MALLPELRGEHEMSDWTETAENTAYAYVKRSGMPCEEACCAFNYWRLLGCKKCGETWIPKYLKELDQDRSLWRKKNDRKYSYPDQ